VLHQKLRVGALLFLVGVNAFIFFALLHESRGEFLVAFLDIGQGDAIYLRSPSGRDMLIDGGPDKGVLAALGTVMPFYDRQIDVIITTHPDKDHIAGIGDVMSRYKVSYLLDPLIESDSPYYEAIKKNANNNIVTAIKARRGMEIDLGRGVRVHIFFPDRDVFGLETNTGSVIARVTYGGTSFLLTGDSPSAIEEYIVSQNGDALRSTVLKAGHHGSKTSSSPIFVSTVAPQYAVISAGRDNQYGHPHNDVIEIFKDNSAKVLSTAERGTIRFFSDGSNLRLE